MASQPPPQPQPPKTIIITGASRGIGLAIAHHLLSHPSSSAPNLVLVSRDRAPLENLQSQHPSQVAILPGDITDPSLSQKVVDLALSRFGGRLDGVVINQGTLRPVSKIADVDVEEVRRAFDVNFFSALATVKAAIPALRASKGRIIMVSSGAAVRGVDLWGAYGASKAAMNHLAQTLRVEEPTITTVAIRPGRVDTEMQREIREDHAHLMAKEDIEALVNAHKTGQLLRPEQPGNVIARLVLGAPGELSGRFLSWNDDALKEFQD